MDLYVGIDFGTSGARAVVIDAETKIQAEAQYPFTAADQINIWRQALFCLFEQIPTNCRQAVRGIAINGTSSTVLLCDAAGKPVTAPILYNDGRGATVVEQLRAIAPPHHLAVSATSSLAKLLWWQAQAIKGSYLLHQADWLAFLLHGQLGISDYHNALKLGYDVKQLKYPDWLIQLPDLPSLPQVLPPGTPVGKVTAEIAAGCGLRQDCLVCAGTTDSIAAFLASGARSPGEAVTSLGSTLVLKLLSRTRVEDSRSGVYSHRLGDLWLAGGASNTGGAVLRQFFNHTQLAELSQEIDPAIESKLDYYPLLQPGDRFPINDPQLLPRLEPRPDESVEFLHGLLESMARIEARGYELLQQLGATQLERVYTAGGGAANHAWAAMRARHLRVPLVKPVNTAAAYGTALLALRGLENEPPSSSTEKR